jgi:putative phosphoribosyl transferase
VSRFVDRRDAGVQLARRLQRFTGRSDVLVVCLTRGGVPVAIEVARAIQAPLEVLHFGSAAIRPTVSTGTILPAASQPDISDRAVRTVIRSSVPVNPELTGNWPATDAGRDIRGKTVIIVDDGLATTTTMMLAEQLIRPLSPARIVIAAPVGAADVCASLRCLVDECVVALAPFPFRQLSDWYSNFPHEDIADVREICWLDSSEPEFGMSDERVHVPRGTAPYLLSQTSSSISAAGRPSGS